MENNQPTDMTEQEKRERIQQLYAEKTALLNRFGLFGGGEYVNSQHERINKQLEALGIEP